MKQFLYTIAALIIFNINASAQQEQITNVALPPVAATAITAKIENNNLLINWNSEQADANYWEVQGSTDGKNFTTIGMVLGQDPSTASNNFKFKQPVAKLKSGVKYYRVLYVDTPETAIASNTFTVAK